MSQAVAEPPKAGTTETPPPKDTRTPEEIQAAAKEFEESWFSNKPKNKPGAAAAATPAKPETQPPAKEETKPAKAVSPAGFSVSELDKLATEGAEGETAPVAPPVAPAVAAPVLDPDEFTDKVVERVTGALKGTTPATPPPTDPNANLSASDRNRMEALEYLEKHNPAYKGITERTREFFTREAAYKAKWLQDNPGEKWNPDDEQHNEFFQKFEPEINQDDLNAALVKVQVAKELPAQVEKVVNERMAPIQEQVNNAQRTALETQIAPEVKLATQDAALSLITQAVPEFKKDLEKGLTQKAIEKIKTEDPEAFDLVNREMVNIRGQVMECERIALMGDLYQPASTNDFQKVQQVHYEMEAAEAHKPIEKRVSRDGKKWIPQALLDKKIDEAKGNRKILAELGSKYFCFDLNDVRNEIVRRAASNVTSVLDIAKKRAERTSAKNPANGTNGTTDAAQNTTVKPAPAPAPSIASASDNVDSRIPRTADTRTEAEKFRDAQFR